MAGKGRPAVQVRGAKELRAALKGMGADLSDLTDLHKRAAEKVAQDARPRAPLLSGALVRTIKAKATRTRGSVVAGSSSVVYAGVQHFGWPAHGIAPHEFLYDALDAQKTNVIGIYEVGVEDLVRKVDRLTPG